MTVRPGLSWLDSTQTDVGILKTSGGNLSITEIPVNYLRVILYPKDLEKECTGKYAQVFWLLTRTIRYTNAFRKTTFTVKKRKDCNSRCTFIWCKYPLWYLWK